jgi:sugar/nucleoside kinase (ribokinase family)/sugar phosphate isomerase/epimerase
MFYLRIIIAILVVIGETAIASSPSPLVSKSSVLVVGSANADTFLSVDRLPTEGENLTLLPGAEPIVDVPGGKGCTQAVAVSKLLQSSSTPSKCLFIGQFGLDPAGKMLHSALEEAGVDCSHCGFHPDLSSGRGYVFLQAQTGSVSAVVSGGSNALGWTEWEHAWEERQKRNGSSSTSQSRSNLEDKLVRILEEEGVRCVLLQREVPECVNLLIASCVKDYNNNKNNKRDSDDKIEVFQDVGGEDRPISKEMLELCDYIVPNESELKRLVKSSSPSSLPLLANHNATEKAMSILPYATHLQQLGAANVLVTMGASGSLYLDKDGSTVYWHSAIGCKAGIVVDETGAGDCYRAAFAAARVIERCEPKQAMLFASAAGSCSVEVNGAVPSTPDRNRIEERIKSNDTIDCKSLQTPTSMSASSEVPRGGESGSASLTRAKSINRPAFVARGGAMSDTAGSASTDDSRAAFPFLIGSRLNSMKDRPDLWTEEKLETPRDYVKRQGTIRGLTCVDFNYPQHFGSSFWTSNKEMKEALEEAGLVAGSVCLRYPSKFARGAMNHPDSALRKEAIELTKEAAEVATELGCDEVVIWSAFDGYDYPFQVNYDEKWDQLVAAFQELCDSFPSIKFSLEYKPTDENTRFFTVPTTGSAMQLVDEIDRPNMGLTLDVGHMLMAGENPGQSIAMVGRKGKLFGIQLNDGFTRLAAEDGLMFGSVHPSMALEIMYQLYKTDFKGHMYFDTFPQRSDPVREAEYNIRQVKRFWYAASEGIDESRIGKINEEHDAIGALELVDDALWSHRK